MDRVQIMYDELFLSLCLGLNISFSTGLVFWNLRPKTMSTLATVPNTKGKFAFEYLDHTDNFYVKALIQNEKSSSPKPDHISTIPIPAQRMVKLYHVGEAFASLN